MSSGAVTDALLNRVVAALADLPAAARPNFGHIAKQLRVSATEVTVAVWQLVNAGRIDKSTLRPMRHGARRSYCQFAAACAAKTTGACARGCKPEMAPANPEPRPRGPRLSSAATRHLNDTSRLVWCGQCDRRVPTGKALACPSRWCKAELPPTSTECPI